MCSFCRSHGARTTSDPHGRLQIVAHDPDQLIRYRFGLKTADFLICGRCGIYVAAVLTTGDFSYATVNVNSLDSNEIFTKEVRRVSYDGEGEAERIKRRKKNWTPAIVILSGKEDSEMIQKRSQGDKMSKTTSRIRQ